MVKRETFVQTLKCKKCGNSGSVDWEENENPVYSGLQRTLKAIEGDFHAGTTQDANGDPDLVCSKCGTKI